LLLQTVVGLKCRSRGMLEQRGDILTVTDFQTDFDVSIFRALNDFCFEALKGSPFVGIVGALWSWPDRNMPRRRKTPCPHIGFER
jgi:hypothetical protein